MELKIIKIIAPAEVFKCQILIEADSNKVDKLFCGRLISASKKLSEYGIIMKSIGSHILSISELHVWII